MNRLFIEGSAKISRSAAGWGSAVDISGISGDWTLVLEVFGIDAGVIVVNFEFLTSADGFNSDVVSGPEQSMPGTLGGNSPTDSGTGSAGHISAYFSNVKRYTWRKGDFPTLRAGVTNVQIKSGIPLIMGSGRVTYATFLEY